MKKKLTRKELENNAFLEGFSNGQRAGIERGKTIGALEERKRMDIERYNTAIKLINSIGQTMQQFAQLLHEDGVIGKLLK